MTMQTTTVTPEIYDALIRDTELGPAQLGAELLDHFCPGWHTNIDLDRLNVRSYVNCILGQLDGWSEFDWDLLPECTGVYWDQLDLKHFGFDASGPADFADLTEDWRTLISDRRSLETTETNQ